MRSSKLHAWSCEREFAESEIDQHFRFPWHLSLLLLAGWHPKTHLRKYTRRRFMKCSRNLNQIRNRTPRGGRWHTKDCCVSWSYFKTSTYYHWNLWIFELFSCLGYNKKATPSETSDSPIWPFPLKILLDMSCMGNQRLWKWYLELGWSDWRMS